MNKPPVRRFDRRLVVIRQRTLLKRPELLVHLVFYVLLNPSWQIAEQVSVEEEFQLIDSQITGFDGLIFRTVLH